MSEAIDGLNYTFVTTEDSTVSVSSNTATFNSVTIKQGIPTTFSYVVNSNDNPTYKFRIPEKNVDTSTLLINVQKSSIDSSYDTYTLSTNPLSLNSSSKVYFLQESTDGYYEIYFGDGIIGKKLTDGNIVKITYLITSGTAAYGANSFVLMNTVGGYANNVITPMIPATKGAEKEDIDRKSTRLNSSHSQQSRMPSSA